MNPLENTQVVPLNIILAIIELNKEFPDIVFGGSIALTAVGLINRKIGDIDIFIPENHPILKSKYINGNNKKNADNFSFEVDSCTRIGIHINDIKVCIFIVKTGLDLLQSSKYPLNNGTINIQNVNHCILAKQQYVKKQFCKSRKKRINDLKNIEQWLNNDLPF